VAISVAVATAPAVSAALSARLLAAISDAEGGGREKISLSFVKAAAIPANHYKIFPTKLSRSE